MARHPLAVSRSPVCAPPFSTLNTQGCWNITDFIQHPPTRKPTLHLVIHLVPFTFCLITLCWQCGFLFSFFLFLIQTHIKVLRFCQQRSRDRVRPQWSEQADQMVQRCLAKKSHPIKTWKSRTSSKPYRQIAREGFSDIMPCLGRQLCYNMPFIDRMWCQT